MRLSSLIVLAALAAACAARVTAPPAATSTPSPVATSAAPGAAAPPQAPARPLTLSIVATSDVHGHVETLPWLGGHVANVRAARAADGGGVLLVDAGDLFQGTLESNLGEGTDVVRAYNQMGYAASAVGNHEFDYGPEGPEVTVRSPEDDPRGALKARAREAKFPFLVSNIIDEHSGAQISWPNMPPGVLVEV